MLPLRRGTNSAKLSPLPVRGQTLGSHQARPPSQEAYISHRLATKASRAAADSVSRITICHSCMRTGYYGDYYIGCQQQPFALWVPLECHLLTRLGLRILSSYSVTERYGSGTVYEMKAFQPRYTTTGQISFFSILRYRSINHFNAVGWSCLVMRCLSQGCVAINTRHTGSSWCTV